MCDKRYLWRKAAITTILPLMLVMTAGFGDGRAWPFVKVSSYRIIDLGTLGGDSSVAAGMNDFGQIVGRSDTATGASHAFLYDHGSMTDLGTLQGGINSEAEAINDRSQIGGRSEINSLGDGFPEILQGFIWARGIMQSLGALYCPCSYNVRYGTSAAHGINNFNQVAGWSETVRGGWVLHALLWQQHTLQDIGGGAGDWSISRAFDINDTGQLVGDNAQDAGRMTSYERHASLWQDGVRQDLGILPGYSSSTALAINDRGQVVGWSGSFDGTIARAFRWEQGRMQDLGTLPGDANSMARDINVFGQTVGWSGTSKTVDSHAVLWDRDRAQDLNAVLPSGSGWILTEAVAINALGQIAGNGLYNGEAHAFLLQPGYQPASWPR